MVIIYSFDAFVIGYLIQNHASLEVTYIVSNARLQQALIEFFATLLPDSYYEAVNPSLKCLLRFHLIITIKTFEIILNDNLIMGQNGHDHGAKRSWDDRFASPGTKRACK